MPGVTGGLDDAGVAAALRDMLLVTLKLGGPPLLAMLAVGLRGVAGAGRDADQRADAWCSCPRLLVLGGMLALLGTFMTATLHGLHARA